MKGTNASVYNLPNDVLIDLKKYPAAETATVNAKYCSNC